MDNKDLKYEIDKFIRDHAQLFRFLWERDDIPTDNELDKIADTWEDEYDGDPPFVSIGDQLEAQATEFDWSLQRQERNNDYPYELSDFLFDADREDRYFGRR